MDEHAITASEKNNNSEQEKAQRWLIDGCLQNAFIPRHSVHKISKAAISFSFRLVYARERYVPVSRVLPWVANGGDGGSFLNQAAGYDEKNRNHFKMNLDMGRVASALLKFHNIIPHFNPHQNTILIQR